MIEKVEFFKSVPEGVLHIPLTDGGFTVLYYYNKFPQDHINTIYGWKLNKSGENKYVICNHKTNKFREYFWGTYEEIVEMINCKSERKERRKMKITNKMIKECLPKIPKGFSNRQIKGAKYLVFKSKLRKKLLLYSELCQWIDTLPIQLSCSEKREVTIDLNREELKESLGKFLTHRGGDD